MQIWTKNNLNFEKPSRNPSYRNKVKILKKKNFDSSPKIFGSAKMFEHRNSGKNRRKRIEFFFEN